MRTSEEKKIKSEIDSLIKKKFLVDAQVIRVDGSQIAIEVYSKRTDFMAETIGKYVCEHLKGSGYTHVFLEFSSSDQFVVPLTDEQEAEMMARNTSTDGLSPSSNDGILFW